MSRFPLRRWVPVRYLPNFSVPHRPSPKTGHKMTLSLLENHLRACLSCWRLAAPVGRIKMIFPSFSIMYSSSPLPIHLSPFTNLIMAIHGYIIRLIILGTRAGDPPGHLHTKEYARAC
eukprot:TRINITY_DN13509_c0_g1_i11.p1 TRINITY_DN13509_c0_g1~~TRINITY_DN13509_c0_g1_i11.p1  ORF type:complete len:118 (-),score=5.54 TRINITY_DN13509_c0_g1_i11:394-747(-)